MIAASSAPVSVMILNVEPGGCRPENAMPAYPSTARSRVEGDDAAEATGQPGHGGAHHRRSDRGAHGSGLVRLRARDHAAAGEQLATRRAEKALVERALEPREADLGALGESELAQPRDTLPRWRPEPADDVRCHVGDLGFGDARLTLGEHGAVAGLQRRPRRHLRRPREVLAATQPGKGEVPSPVDADRVAVLGHGQVGRGADPPEDPRADLQRHAHDAGRELPRGARDGEPLPGRDGEVLAMQRGEALGGHPPARGGRQLRVHGAEVAAGPGLRVAAGECDAVGPARERRHRGRHGAAGDEQHPDRHEAPPEHLP